MAYELTINRTVAFFDTKNVTLQPEELQRQVNLMAEGDFEAAYSAAIATATKMGAVIQSIPRPKKSEVPDERPGAYIIWRSHTGDDKAHTKHPVAFFTQQYFTLKTEKQTWQVRMRPTITFPTPGNSGLTHLWWTTEGVLHDPAIGYDKRPDRQDAVWLTQIASTMAESALPHLRDVYRNAVNTDDALVIRPDRIRVSLSDNHRKPLAYLLDAMIWSRASFAEAKDRTMRLKDDTLVETCYLHHRHESPYRDKSEQLDDIAKGAMDVASFIQDIIGAPTLSGLTPTLYQYDAREFGVIGRYERQTLNGGREITVAGLTRHIAHRDNEWLRSDNRRWADDHEPRWLRAYSAAIPLSKKYAEQEAFKFEKSLKRSSASARLPAPA